MPNSHAHDPIRGFKYKVTIDPGTGNLITLGCNRVSGLRSETEIVEYREGTDFATTRKLPGLTSYDNIVLEHGFIEDVKLFSDWYKRLKTVNTDGTSDTNPDTIRGMVMIEVYRREDYSASNAVARYTVVNAWPTIYEAADLDSSASDVWFERIELAHEGWELEVL